MASPSAGAPALKYGDVNTEATSPGEVKGLIKQENIFSKSLFEEKNEKKEKESDIIIDKNYKKLIQSKI